MNKIGQHFLLSDKARIMSLMDIFRLGDDEAFDLFKQARWAGNNGEPVCPHCGGAYHYHIKTRKQWRCKACGHTFPTGSIHRLHLTPAYAPPHTQRSGSFVGSAWL